MITQMDKQITQIIIKYRVANAKEAEDTQRLRIS